MLHGRSYSRTDLVPNISSLCDCAPRVLDSFPSIDKETTKLRPDHPTATMTGYGALAKMMVSRRNQETFRKFKRLNSEVMLHQQAELMHLEMVIEQIRKYPGMNEFDRRWIECPEKLSERDIESIFERSRELLAQYREF